MGDEMRGLGEDGGGAGGGGGKAAGEIVLKRSHDWLMGVEEVGKGDHIYNGKIG